MGQETVTLAPGESTVVSFDVTPSEAGIYHVTVDSLEGTFTVLPPAFAWISPTGYIDPQNDWGKYPYWPPEAAYDDDESTFATCTITHGPNWSGWLELTHSELLCSKVRYLVMPSNYTNLMQLEVEWDGVRHLIYEGSPRAYIWCEHELGGTYLVSAMRLRFWRSRADKLAAADVYEADFWGMEGNI